MSISLIQTVKVTQAATNPVAGTLLKTTSGNFLIAACRADAGGANYMTVTDNKGNTWARAFSQASGGADVELWYSQNIQGGASHVVNISNTGGNNIVAILREYSVGALTGLFDQKASTIGTSTAANSGASPTTTAINELVVGIAGDSDGSTQVYAAGGGYGNLSFQTGSSGAIALEDKLVTTTGAQTANFTLTNSAAWACGVATFVEGPGKPSFKLNALRPHAFSPGLAR